HDGRAIGFRKAQRHSITLIRRRYATPAQILLRLELQLTARVVFVSNGHEIGLEAIPHGDRETPRQRRFYDCSPFRPPVSRAATSLAGLVQWRRLDWLARKVHSSD